MRSAIVNASIWSWVTMTVGLSSLVENFLDLRSHRLAQLDVETAQGLVEQKAGGVADDRAPDRDALLFALAELVGAALRESP